MPRVPPQGAPERSRARIAGWAALAAALVLAVAPSHAAAQAAVPLTEDASLPRAGDVRFEISPGFQSWNEVLGEAGTRVPLRERLDGEVLSHVAPGPAAYASALNADAEALGFDPIPPFLVSLGQVEAREVRADVRSVPFRVEAGVQGWLALDLTVPLVLSDAEVFTEVDPATATLGPADGGLADPGAFLQQMASARDALEQQIQSGTLTAQEEQLARQLLQASGAFADALRPRVLGGGFLPRARTLPGFQIRDHYGDLADGFASFGLSLPSFALPREGAADALRRFVAGPGSGTLADGYGISLGEVEAGAKALVVDGFGSGDGLRARTALGLRYRFALSGPNEAPFLVPSNLLGVPAGDGQDDLELSLYQDFRAGGLRLGTIVRYGFQLEDRLTLRIHPSGDPLALPSTEARLVRDLGDYVQVRLAPRWELNEFLEVGAEYRLWYKGKDDYRLAPGAAPPAGVDPDQLEQGTEGTRHRLGIGALFRLEGMGLAGAHTGPRLGFVHQLVAGGAGLRTPAAGLTTFHVQVPVSIF